MEALAESHSVFKACVVSVSSPISGALRGHSRWLIDDEARSPNFYSPWGRGLAVGSQEELEDDEKNKIKEHEAITFFYPISFSARPKSFLHADCLIAEATLVDDSPLRHVDDCPEGHTDQLPLVAPTVNLCMSRASMLYLARPSRALYPFSSAETFWNSASSSTSRTVHDGKNPSGGTVHKSSFYYSVSERIKAISPSVYHCPRRRTQNTACQRGQVGTRV